MGRYRGKREAPRPEREGAHRIHGEDRPAAGGVGDPFAGEEEIFPVGDPFAEENAETPTAAKAAGAGRFFRSRKGRVITIVLGCVLAFAVGGILAVRSWVRPPELPQPPAGGQQEQQGKPDGEDTAPEQPHEPTDDELYPDDGYDGDMPTVSGDRKEGIYTFLLVGTDKDDGNTDTIMVASYDTVNQAVSIMSIPRDTMINESWDIKKINSVYSRTGSSIESLAKRVKKLVGFAPDFYVKVELSMFVELVDLIGGVEFDVPQDMDYDDDWQDLHIHLKKGVQVLDGQKAMQLVRFRRYSEGDIKRVEVQQNFMKALIKECLSLEHWGKIKAYIDLAMKNVQTNLEFGSVVWFAANVLGLNGNKPLDMNNIYTCTIPGNYWASAWSRATHQEQSYVTIYPNQVVTLVNERFNPYQQKVTTGMLDAMSILDNGDIASSTGNLKDQQHNAVMAVRRGEAYYDEAGNIVYGKPPVKPEVDASGQYYILDENGNIVYTDANGTPLEPAAPPAEGGETIPGEDGGAGQPVDPGQVPGTEQPTEPVLPTEPVSPPEGGGTENSGTESGGDDTVPPGWL